MVDLVRENQENRRRLALSAVCAGITAVAVGALIVIASFSNCQRARESR